MKAFIPALLLILICLSMIYCDWPYPISEPIEKDDLYGRYIANFGETDTNFFDLIPDSLFVSYYKTETGQLFVDTGTWYFDKRAGTQYNLRIFHYYRRHPERCVYYPEKEELIKRYNVDTTKVSHILHKRGTSIIVRYCPQRGWYYKKIVE